jgi:ribose-phosphate pyrophosphokinase
MKQFLVFSGTSNPKLTDAIAKKLAVPVGRSELTRFSDGEIRPWMQEDVRDKTVFVVESFSKPMDEYIMEMVLIGDAVKRCAPKRIIGVIPYMGYARQDKQHRIGEPISARLIAKFIEVSGFDEIIGVDLHNDAIVGFFQIPVTHISAMPVLMDAVKALKSKSTVIVSPDVGGVRRARNAAYYMEADLIVMEKKRYLDRRDVSENFQIIGDVSGKTAVILDDIISTGGTIANSAYALKKAGAVSIIVCASHAVLSGEAKKVLEKAPIDRLIVTDTITHADSDYPKGTHIVPMAPRIAEAITNILR